MSVSNPVDSGGRGLHTFDKDLQGIAEKMNTVGGWAELMAQDSANNTLDDDDLNREEVVEEQSHEYTDFSHVQRHPGPYLLQLCNVPNDCDKDELCLLLGGDDLVEDIEIKEHRRAVVTFKTFEHYAKIKSDTQDCKIKYREKPLRAFNMPTSNAQPPHTSYSRQNSQFGSTTSLASSHYGYSERHYENRKFSDANMPPHSGYNRDDRSNRGSRRGYRSDRGYYQRNYDGPGQIQRSGSYSHDDRQPAPINRSRTEDGLSDRRQPGMSSRTSSRYSIDQDGEQKSVGKKPSQKDIFGEAKPVDTEKKLKEYEEKTERKKLEAEKAEKDKQEKIQKQQQHQHHQQQQHQHHHQQQQQQHQINHPMQPQPYYQPYIQSTQPTFATPIVNMGPGGVHPPHSMNTPPPLFSTVDQSSRGPGAVRIVQRSEAERDSNSIANMSPPLDPEHPRQTVSQISSGEHRIETIKEEPSPLPARRPSGGQENIRPDAQGKSGGHQKHVYTTRTITRSQRHDGESSHNSHRGRGRGRGGYGGHGGGPHRNDGVPQTKNFSEKNNNTEASTIQHQTADGELRRENKKEMHGSQASLSSRGGGRGSRGNRGRGGPKHRPPRNDRKPLDEPKSDLSKEQPKPQQQRKLSEDEVPKEKCAPAPTQEKVEPKKDLPKDEPVSAPKTEPAPAVPAADIREKKNNKKKKQNASKNATPLGGNKFAALANATDE